MLTATDVLSVVALGMFAYLALVVIGGSGRK